MKRPAKVTQKADGSLELVEVNPIIPEFTRGCKYISSDPNFNAWENFVPAKFHTEDKDLIVGSVVDLDDFDIHLQFKSPRTNLWHFDSKVEISISHGLPRRQTACKKAVAEAYSPSGEIAVEGKETEQAELTEQEFHSVVGEYHNNDCISGTLYNYLKSQGYIITKK